MKDSSCLRLLHFNRTYCISIFKKVSPKLFRSPIHRDINATDILRIYYAQTQVNILDKGRYNGLYFHLK